MADHLNFPLFSTGSFTELTLLRNIHYYKKSVRILNFNLHKLFILTQPNKFTCKIFKNFANQSFLALRFFIFGLEELDLLLDPSTWGLASSIKSSLMSSSA